MGVLVNVGFLPAQFRHPSARRSMLRGSSKYHSLIGVVTRNRNLQKSTLFRGGNVQDEQRFSLRNFNLADMAAFSSLTNREAARAAVIERVDVGATAIDESDPLEYNVDLNTTQNIPYGKVRPPGGREDGRMGGARTSGWATG